MFMSYHNKDKSNPKINVNLFEDSDFQGVNDFERHPVCVEVEGAILYFRAEEAHELAVKLNKTLQELDRRRINNSWGKGV